MGKLKLTKTNKIQGAPSMLGGSVQNSKSLPKNTHSKGVKVSPALSKDATPSAFTGGKVESCSDDEIKERGTFAKQECGDSIAASKKFSR